MTDLFAVPWSVEVHDHKVAYLGPITGKHDPYDGGGDIVEPTLEVARRGYNPDTLRRVAACVNACRGIPTEDLENVLITKHCHHTWTWTITGLPARPPKVDRTDDLLESL